MHIPLTLFHRLNLRNYLNDVANRTHDLESFIHSHPLTGFFSHPFRPSGNATQTSNCQVNNDDSCLCERGLVCHGSCAWKEDADSRFAYSSHTKTFNLKRMKSYT